MRNVRMYVSAGIGLAVAFGITAFITVNEIGPRIFWSNDVCPDPTVTCGVLPVGVLLATFLGAIVAVWVAGVLNVSGSE